MKKEVKLGSVAFPTPVYIVGSYNEDGSANGMNAAWGGICASEPPAVMVAIRKNRQSYENIMKRKAFTINFPNEEMMEIADYFGLVSGKKEDKIEKAKVTVVKGMEVEAPYFDEFPVSLECSLIETLEVGTHTLFIGHIKRVIADENVLNEKEQIDVEKVAAIGYDPVGKNYIQTSKVVGKAFSAGLGLLKDEK